MPSRFTHRLARRRLAAAICFSSAAMAGVFAPAPLALAQPATGAAASTPTEAARTYHIPAGPLTGALNRFAAEAGIFLVGNARLTDGKNSAGLNGAYSVENALTALLGGSGLEAARQPNGSYTLREASVVLKKVHAIDSEEVLPNELPPVYAGGQVARGGRLGLLGNKSVFDAPFNITSYTAQVIENQQARSIADVLANDPSARLSSARTNISDDFSLRGFPVASQDVALNGMYGLMPFFRVPVEMAERVEVLKGPSALLNGIPPSGNIGGAINVVSKRAGAEPLTRVTASYLSDSVFGAELDAGRRFGDQQQFGVRANLAYRDGGTTIDQQDLKEVVGSLGLDYTIERLRLSADIIYQYEDIDKVVRQFTAGPGLTKVPHAPDNSSNYPGYGRSKMSDHTLLLRAEYDLTENLNVYAGYGDRHSKMDAVAGNPTLNDSNGDYSSAPAWQVYVVDSHSAQAGLNFNFSTGPVNHQLTASATRVIQNSDIYFLFSGFGTRNSNLFDPVYSPTPSTSGLSGHPLKYTASAMTSYALADTLSMLNDQVQLTLGARRQKIEARNFTMNVGTPSGDPYDKSATTPSLGLVIKPWQNVSFYANYIEGLSQGPSAPIGADNAGKMFAPYKTKQKEIGVKGDWGGFVTTLAAFEIKRPSGITQNNHFSVNGEQRNRGLELNVFGALTDRVRLLGGAAYTRGELTKTQGGAFDGNDAVAVPKVQINLGTEWDAPFAPGVTLTARGIYTGKQYIDQANRLEVPQSTRFDVGARYKTVIAEKPVVFRLNVDNVFNRNYWGASNFGYLYLGDPRTVQLSATVDF